MKSILTDTTKCIGCFACAEACRRTNRTGKDVPFAWSRGDGLSSESWTTVVRRPGQKFVRKQCRHCLKPACASACPVGALHRTELGAVVYDGDRCMGCRYCMMACPYGIPRYLWSSAVPRVRKCILCHDRIQAGKPTSCTAACPTGATIFGERHALLREAHARLKADPRYQRKVWGEREVGGTAVLYISDVNLDFLAVHGKPLGDAPLPDTTAPALRAVPFVFLGVASFMTATYFIIERRRKLAGLPAGDPAVPGSESPAVAADDEKGTKP
jgi:formate dehydrogenase iron-sulfur subunit